MSVPQPGRHAHLGPTQEKQPVLRHLGGGGFGKAMQKQLGPGGGPALPDRSNTCFPGSSQERPLPVFWSRSQCPRESSREKTLTAAPRPASLPPHTPVPGPYGVTAANRERDMNR